MTNPTRHTDPKHRYQLPPDVAAALNHESDEERAGLAEAWLLAGRYLDQEPDDATFRALGKEIWQNLEAALQNQHQLPPELAEALKHESDEERAGLAEAWAVAGHYRGQEPGDATFCALGTEIRHNLEAALEQEAGALSKSPLRLVKPPLRLVKPQTLRWVAAAACIVLLVAVGLVFTNQPIRIEAPYGEQFTHTLPDGSTVTLNSGTRISYASSFGDETRRIKLVRGEVFLDVTKQDESFSVQTFNSAVTVLGTQFNVRAWPSDFDAATEVVVAEGTVRFAPRRDPAQALILEAGDAARLDREASAPMAMVLDSVNTQNALSWRSGGFKYSKHTVGTVINELERRFDVRIKVSSNSLLSLDYGVLKDNPLGAEEIIRDICELKHCQYRTVPGGYEITEAAAE